MGELRAEVDGELAHRGLLVAHPVGMGVRQDLAVHPAAAAGAHLEDQVGKCSPDRVLQAIQTLVVGDQRIVPGQFRGQAGGPATGVEIGIEVPFHPADAVPAQHAGQPLEDVVPGRRHAEIENGTLVGRRRRLPVDMVQPLRMLAPDRRTNC